MARPRVLVGALVVLASLLPLHTATASVFPPAGVDIVNHDLRVDLDVGADNIVEERLVFHGEMVIRRGEPFTNSSGLRQIDFVVLDWVATAFSDTLGVEIDYVTSPEVDQPISTIVSEQIGSDFPARFTFNVIFDVFADGSLVFIRHHGRPEGGGFMSVPPDANSPRITQFEDARIVVNHPQLGPILFTPFDCQDLRSETVPGPSTVLLLGLGLAAVIARQRQILLPRRLRRSGCG